MSQNNLVWSTPIWSDEFRIEFDMIVTSQDGSWKSLFHMTRDSNCWMGWGCRVPAVYAQSGKVISIKSCVWMRNIRPKAAVILVYITGRPVITKSGTFNIDCCSERCTVTVGMFNVL